MMTSSAAPVFQNGARSTNFHQQRALCHLAGQQTSTNRGCYATFPNIHLLCCWLIFCEVAMSMELLQGNITGPNCEAQTVHKKVKNYILISSVWRESDAIVSAMQYCPLQTLLHMQSCPELCKNRLSVQVCACKRACMHWTYVCSMNIHLFYDCREYPTAEHFPCHTWHALTLYKNGERVPPTKGV